MNETSQVISYPKTIVLTGGPGVGKTSIIQRLKEINYPVRKEVFTELFRKAQDEGRFNEAFLHSRKLIHDLVSAQVDLESQATQSEIVFLDRGRIDIWGFAKNMEIIPDQKDQKKLEDVRYDAIFVVDPMPKKFYDQNAVRRQSYEESLEHHQALIERYTEFLKFKDLERKVRLFHVPFIEGGSPSSISERTEFILTRVKGL